MQFFPGIAEKNFNCDIPGLHSRVKTPLEFLGLYGTQFGACRRHDIPAKKVSKEVTWSQQAKHIVVGLLNQGSKFVLD